jgi:antiviral helicase SKI2
MIKNCTELYTGTHNNYGSFTLSDFQKYSIEAIANGCDSLVLAKTGSGKTLCAEYAITHFTKSGGRVIYISPIKALSNQKYYEFCRKFPNIRIGILTGDIKCNPDANVIIMTSEILRNKLFGIVGGEYDFSLEGVKCLVIDEVHYINDEERGNVWEEIIIKMSTRSYASSSKAVAAIQFVMLSATLDNPISFAQWIANMTKRDIWISGTKERIVPLNHYSMLFFKKVGSKDKELQKLIESYTEPILLKAHEGTFVNYDTVNKIVTNYNNSNNGGTDKQFVINSCIDYLFKNELLPAIFFSLSRKNVETYASFISTCVQPDGIKIATVASECRKIISKFPNYEEYLCLPDYQKIVRLLEKGIAFHHSGMLSVLREMIEILFERGYVKLLFATETFAVGINMPTKTVVFDSLYKYDGNGHRLLKSYEYSQMAGRAGRRGIDEVGHVFHLNNCFQMPSLQDYANIMNGANLKLESKFKINNEFVLRMMMNNDNGMNGMNGMNGSTKCDDGEEVAKNSGITKQVEEYINVLKYELANTPVYTFINNHEIVEEYYILKNSKQNNKIKNKIAQFKKDYADIDNDYMQYEKELETKNKTKKLQKELEHYENYIPHTINTIKQFLTDNGFICDGKLTPKGRIAASVHEVNGLVVAEIIGELNDYETEEIVVILYALVTGATLPIIKKWKEYYNDEKGNEEEENERVEIIREWINATNTSECLAILQGIETGTFTKNILKISNLVRELSSDDVLLELRHKLSAVPQMILKFVVVNQSIYV